jgi:polyhydroxyalkanoate synthesis regulator phasin
MGEDTRTIEREIEQTRERMGETVQALSYKADVPTRVRDSVADKKDAVVGKLANVRDSITGTAGSAAEATGEATAQVGDGARKAAGIAQENPLGLVIGSVAVGFLVGSLLPKTRIEEERVGPVASQVREQVTEVASEAVEHGKQVAQEATRAAIDTAKESGREHAEDLGESVKQTTAEPAAEPTRELRQR